MYYAYGWCKRGEHRIMHFMWQPPINFVQAVMLLTCMREFLGSNLDRTFEYPEVFRSSLQLFQEIVQIPH
jgi:hypothetical protein